MVVLADHLLAGSFPQVTQASVDDLGITHGTPQMSGFVFVDGCYLPPPYTVTRRGNAIFINRIQIEQPVAWSYFDSSAEVALPVDIPQVRKAVDEDQDFAALDDSKENQAENPAPKKVSTIDDLFSDEQENAVTAPAKPAETKTISSIDDLFGDDDDDEPVVKQSSKSINSIDDLFGDDKVDDDVASDVVKTTLDPVVIPLVAKRARAPQSAADLEEKKAILKKRLEDKRYSYERAISKGELYFFGPSHDLINGNYGTARTLIDVLPAALRYSRSPEELLLLLQSGDVYFIDLGTCEALYRNKTTFPLLQQRLDRIKQMEEIKSSKRN